jgi:hypothetical protein
MITVSAIGYMPCCSSIGSVAGKRLAVLSQFG